MVRIIFLFLKLGWFAALVATVLTYYLQTQPMFTTGILQWTTLILLIFTFALFAGIGVRCHIDRAHSGLPAEINFSIISKWGLRW